MEGPINPRSAGRLCVMVMGPSGVGKSTLAQALARAIGAGFIEGDDHHPAENRATMAAGRPLTDQMRAPWLAALVEAVNASLSRQDTVFACSALRRSYRDRLRRGIGRIHILNLVAPPDLIRDRMMHRQHFMPAALLGSQLRTLEAPDPDENALTLDMSRDLGPVIREARDWLAR